MNFVPDRTVHILGKRGHAGFHYVFKRFPNQGR